MSDQSVVRKDGFPRGPRGNHDSACQCERCRRGLCLFVGPVYPPPGEFQGLECDLPRGHAGIHKVYRYRLDDGRQAIFDNSPEVSSFIEITYVECERAVEVR